MSTTVEQSTTSEELKKKCVDLYRELRELNVAVQASYKATLLESDRAGRPPAPALSRLRQRRLLAETATVKQASVQPLAGEPEVMYELLEADLNESIQELEICLSCIQSEERRLVLDIQRLQVESGQHAEADQTLSHKLRAALGKEEESEDTIVAGLKKKTQIARTYSSQLLKDMAEFVNTHFPAPRTRTRNLSGPREPGEGDQPPRYKPMLALVEALMNECVDSPHDPYVQLDDTYWKPHVEHLLRYNIALRHPDVNDRIKLVPFHL